MKIRHFFDEQTSTLTYMVHDEDTKSGVVIDTVTDFDPNSGRTSNESNDKVAGFIDEVGLTVPYVLETHAHADHFTGLQYFKLQSGSKTVIGKYITGVQAIFRDIFNLGADFPADGSPFDVLLQDGETLYDGIQKLYALPDGTRVFTCHDYMPGGRELKYQSTIGEQKKFNIRLNENTTRTENRT